MIMSVKQSNHLKELVTKNYNLMKLKKLDRLERYIVNGVIRKLFELVNKRNEHDFWYYGLALNEFLDSKA